MSDQKFDLFVFGSTSELMQAVFREHKAWFGSRINRLIITQRSESYPNVYRDFSPVAIKLDCADPRAFRERLAGIVADHASTERPMHVFPTYGVFNWNYAKKNPVFSFRDDAYQINLNSRLQIIEAFRAHKNARFHLLGSLFANFPYTGDYALSMWYINQLPRNAEYRDLDLIVYNLGGMKTRFWNWQSMPNNPFVYDTIPTGAIVETGFKSGQRGVVTVYPTVASRVACFMGRMGVRVL